jgi:hypothetical protein
MHGQCGICVAMKVDSMKQSLSDKRAYLKQVVTCQTTDIRVGFLVSLRHKAFDATRVPPHLNALVGCTVFDVPGDSVSSRHRHRRRSGQPDQTVGHE